MRSSRLWPWWLGLGATIVVLGGGLSWAFGQPNEDWVSQAERDELQRNFAAAAPLELPRVPAERLDAALGQMKLPAVEAESLRRGLAGPASLAPVAVAAPAPATEPAAQPVQDAPHLVELTLWDTQAPDGDVVAVTSGGYSRQVMLTRTPQVIAIPVIGRTSVKITGIRDGGGGITLGLRGQHQLLMPIMSEGQVLNLPGGR